MRPDQFLQLVFMVRRKLNRWGLGCRHGSPSLSRQGGDSHSESTPDSPATAGGEPISAVCCTFDSPQRGTESPLSARCTRQFLLDASERCGGLPAQNLARWAGGRQAKALADRGGFAGPRVDAARYRTAPAAAVLYGGRPNGTARDDGGSPARRPGKIRPYPPGTWHLHRAGHLPTTGVKPRG